MISACIRLRPHLATIEQADHERLISWPKTYITQLQPVRYGTGDDTK